MPEKLRHKIYRKKFFRNLGEVLGEVLEQSVQVRENSYNVNI